MKAEILANALCKALYSPEYKRFKSPLEVKKIQKNYLKNLLQKNARTAYGKKYDFAKIKNYKDFKTLVPLTVYEDYEPFIRRISEGEKRVLTKEKVLLFELTSGSSGGKKLIPYTKSLKYEFQRGIRPWLGDILENVKGVSRGKSYWSITPLTDGKKRAKCGIPIGFEEDAEYFGALSKFLMKKIFVSDSLVKFSKTTREFYLKTAKALLQSENLTLISVWNPTFLTILCDFLRDNSEELCETLPKNRREKIKKALKAERFERVFPDLKIISCWADGSAADFVNPLYKRFRGVYIQPKGLLSTECFTSFPLVGESGARLSVFSHFFEFKSLKTGKIYPAHAVKKGEFEVVVTTGGGFYRYQTGDVVEILETYKNAPPRLKFLRRSGITSDLFGEKLTEDFVKKALSGLIFEDDFALLAPEKNHYILFTTAKNISPRELEKRLCESFHYNYCRQLGQLGPAEIINVKNTANEIYISRLTAEGLRLGDIKPAHLSAKQGWSEYFEKS